MTHPSILLLERATHTAAGAGDGACAVQATRAGVKRFHEMSNPSILMVGLGSRAFTK